MGDAPSSHVPPETSLSAEARAALTKLTGDVPAAASLMQEAKGVLIFPGVTKGGFIVGGFHGEGVLFKQGRIHGYYDTGGATYGLQAGIQNYGYALFFMSDSALHYVDDVHGWEIGVGPSIVIVDAGMGKSLTTTTANKDIYGFIFDQKGLMAGMGLQGSKIVRVDR
jgi:lipid-binding SYLF domain-containing protein